MLHSKHCRASVKRLKKMEKRLPDSNLRFAIPACFRGLGHFKWLKYFQHPEEIYSLYTLMLQEYPKNIVEIGTARGGTLYLWLQAATEDAVVISIDLPGGKFGGGYRECRVPFYQSFKKADQRLHLLRCNSRDPANPGKIKKFVEDEIKAGRADKLTAENFEAKAREITNDTAREESLLPTVQPPVIDEKLKVSPKQAFDVMGMLKNPLVLGGLGLLAVMLMMKKK